MGSRSRAPGVGGSTCEKAKPGMERKCLEGTKVVTAVDFNFWYKEIQEMLKRAILLAALLVQIALFSLGPVVADEPPMPRCWPVCTDGVQVK